MSQLGQELRTARRSQAEGDCGFLTWSSTGLQALPSPPHRRQDLRPWIGTGCYCCLAVSTWILGEAPEEQSPLVPVILRESLHTHRCRGISYPALRLSP